ncbi:MAG: enoyl-CoA hydratase/isomerase family protein [Gammaproteobacteria bacterium]|nr:enoyl-CoA hydratase/isomerase family protein [Gammaproteobacteria bacterium]
MTEFIQTKAQDGIFHIQFARQQAKNAISLDMYQRMVDELTKFENDDSHSVAVIYGDENCFTAGNDLADFLAGGQLTESHPTVKFLFTLAQLKKPLIAAVAGPAIGIGTTLLLHCDLVYAADNSVLQLPFAQLGLCPEAASSLLLPQQIGHQRAFELLVLGQKFDAESAKQFGFVNQVTSPNNVVATALVNAKALVDLSSEAVTSSKSLMKKSNQQKVEETIRLELQYFDKLMNSEQCKQIISQFFKR